MKTHEKRWFVKTGGTLYAIKSQYDVVTNRISVGVYPQFQDEQDYKNLMYKIAKFYLKFYIPEKKKTTVAGGLDKDLEPVHECMAKSMLETRIAEESINVIPRNYQDLWEDEDNFKAWYHSVSK